MMIRENKGVTYLTFEKLDRYKELHYGFSTRLGGVSEGVYGSMNLGFGRGDAEENVRENFRRMADAIEIDFARMCFSKQTHTVNVHLVTEKDAGNYIMRGEEFQDVDGLITKVRNLPLVTFYADCVPLLLYDPVQQAIGLSHSGWRGTVGQIGKVTVEKMTEVFGSRPEDIVACIGPSICKECYEVSEDVAAAFRKVYGEKAEEFLRPSTIHPQDPGKYMLDLWAACRENFLQAGVRADNIEVSDYCTRCHPELFYSHRIMGAQRGSLAAFMALE